MKQIQSVKNLESASRKFRTQADIETPLNAPEPSKVVADSALAKDTNPFAIPNEPSTLVMKGNKARNINDAMHFEDVAYDLQYLMKKASMSYVKNIMISPSITTIRTISIADDILFPDGTGTASEKNGGGLIGWFSPIYRGFRGDIRLKIVIQVSDEGGGDEIPTIHGWASHSQESKGTVDQQTGTVSMYSNANLNFPTTTTDPKFFTPAAPHGHTFIISPSVPEIVEITIPYSCLGNFVIPSTYLTSTNQDPYGLGTLILAFNSDSSAGHSIILRIYSFLDDAARFGIPWMVPKVQILPLNFPDYYGEPTAEGPLRPNNSPTNSEDEASDYVEIPDPDYLLTRKYLARARSRPVNIRVLPKA
jgi:hypothetical protein